MSDYYDITKPYRREDDWNALVEAVNEILQAPPDDTDCDPIDEIPLADPDHIWMVADVEEVRDKLSETCPDIEFAEELEYWKSAIIDEIETEMEKAWCDCEATTGVECTEVDYTVTESTIEASPDPGRCCGATYYEYFGTLCPVDWSQETIYTSNSYPLNYCNNTAKDASFSVQYNLAWAKSHLFAGLWDDLIALSEDIDDKQSELDTKEAAVDAAIAAYEYCLSIHTADPSICDTLKPPICTAGGEARTCADELQDLLDDFTDLKDDLDASKIAADDAATAALAIIMSYQIDRPGDENLSGPLATFLTTGNVAWADLIDPRSSNAVRQVPYRAAPTVTNQVVPNCRIYKWTYAGQLGKQSMWAEISPSGIPYWRNNNVITNVVNWYFLKTETSRCDNWGGHYCACGAIACDLCPPDYYWCGGFLWDRCDGTSGSFLCAPMDELSTYIAATMKQPNGLTGGMCCSSITSKVDKQTEFFDLYLDWYAEHPEYDDRHDPYC